MKLFSVFGGANTDILGIPERDLPARDSGKGSIIIRPGGVGRNIAEHLARSGEKCKLYTAFGADPLSSYLKDMCRKSGIDISDSLTIDGNGCKYLCMHDGMGDMAVALNDMHLMEKLTVAYADLCLEKLNSSAVCILDANPPTETLLHIAQNIKVPLIMDPVSCEKAKRILPILPYLTALKPNIQEARAITGCESPEECAKKLLGTGVKYMFISLGSKGLFYADEKNSGYINVVKERFVPVTGAGDALCAGLALSIASNSNIRECAVEGMRFAAEFLDDYLK